MVLISLEKEEKNTPEIVSTPEIANGMKPPKLGHFHSMY